MKKTKKLLAFCASAAALLVGFTACNRTNTAPVLTGVADQAIEAGTEFVALAGVTAMDKEDGDITSRITIDSTPALNFKNGKAVPEKAGNYELVYTVTDKGGEKAESYATLTVTKATSDAVLYRSFDFTKAQTVDAKGWTADVAGGVDAKGELKEGSYVFTVNNPGNGDGDIKLHLSGLAVKPADYCLKVWAKSTADTYAHIIARDESAAGWETFGGAFNVRITKEIAPLTLNFSANKKSTTELMINLGKITPNPNNPADTTPEHFTVTIDKIELYEITGDETESALYTQNFAKEAAGAVTVSAGDGAAAHTAWSNGAESVVVDSYPTSGGVWSIKTDIALAGNKIEEGKKYFYRFTVNSANPQSGECLVESASLYDAQRVHFNSFASGADASVVSGVFTADKAISDPVIRLQIGNPSAGVTANELHIDDVVFGVIEGDKEIAKTIYAFTAFGPATANAKDNGYPWQTFNGTDEDNDRGVGTIWTDNGKLYYRIDNGGITDWHNKLICGYGDNPVTLESDSYYELEITAKATKDVSCAFFLNPMGNWDPRISQTMDLSTTEKTFRFKTTDTFITDMNFEVLFQFGSDATAQLGEVTIEISEFNIYQKKVL